MAALRVPYAFDTSGCLRTPEEANREDQFSCPGCEKRVLLKHGTIRKRHFAHKASDICSQESIEHKIAKALIQHAVLRWIAGEGEAPRVLRPCNCCNMQHEQPLPTKVQDARLEYRLGNGFVVDIALIAQEAPVAAIEIRVSHAVDDDKERELGLPFLELAGEDVLENPYLLKPIKDLFRPYRCDSCRSAPARFHEKAKAIAERLGIELPLRYFRYGVWKCYRCKRGMLVYTWPGSGFFGTRRPTFEPIPSTIKFRYSREMRLEYWANTCPRCGRIQGDHYLSRNPGGPFWGIHCETDSEDSFEIDMLQIAMQADRAGLL